MNENSLETIADVAALCSSLAGVLLTVILPKRLHDIQHHNRWNSEWINMLTLQTSLFFWFFFYTIDLFVKLICAFCLIFQTAQSKVQHAALTKKQTNEQTQNKTRNRTKIQHFSCQFSLKLRLKFYFYQTQWKWSISGTSIGVHIHTVIIRVCFTYICTGLQCAGNGSNLHSELKMKKKHECVNIFGAMFSVSADTASSNRKQPL